MPYTPKTYTNQVTAADLSRAETGIQTAQAGVDAAAPQAAVDLVESRAGVATKRFVVPAGAVGSSKVMNAVPDLNPRNVIVIPVPSTRWRMRLRNYMSANSAPFGAGTGVFTMTGLGIGTPLTEPVTSTSTLGRNAGKATTALTQALVGATITDDAEYVSEWVTDTTLQFGPTARLVSLGMRTASGAYTYGADTLNGPMFYGTGAANDYLAAAPAFPAILAQYFDWRLEIECVTSRLIVLCLGESTMQGASGGDGGCWPHEAWPGAAAMRKDFLAINGGISGTTTSNWLNINNWQYQRLLPAEATLPDVSICAFGTNDGFSNTQVPVNYQAIRLVLEAAGIKRHYIGSPLQYNYTAGGGSEITRLAVLSWMRGLPFGWEGFLDFDREIALTTDVSQGDPAFMPTPPHPRRGGYQRMASIVPNMRRAL